MRHRLQTGISVFIFLIASICVHAQNEFDMNLLKAPQSPAASFLGIADSEISRPSDPAAFMVNLRQASNNFSMVPLNYAVDFAPWWVFAPKSIQAADFLGNELPHNFKQSFVVSFAVNNEDQEQLIADPIENTSVALGVKFSLLRGNVKPKTQEALDKAYALSEANSQEMAMVFTAAVAENEEYQEVLAQILELSQNPDAPDFGARLQILSLQGELIQKKIGEQVDAEIADNRQAFIDISKDFDFSRTGFKLDFQSAVAWDFPGQLYDARKLRKAGAWVTAAMEGDEHFSFLGLARFQHMPNELVLDDMGMLAEVSMDAFDAGARLMYSDDRFSFSGEYIYRSVSGSEALETTNKWAVNAEYAVAKNQKLILTYGKDFDGTVEKDGNVLAALNFLMGFGSKRDVGTGGTEN